MLVLDRGNNFNLSVRFIQECNHKEIIIFDPEGWQWVLFVRNHALQEGWFDLIDSISVTSYIGRFGYDTGVVFF